MSLAINAAPFESNQNSNKTNTLLTSKLAQFKHLNKSKPKSIHNKTQKSFKEGFDFKMDKDKMEAMLKNVQNVLDNIDSDDEDSMGDFKSMEDNYANHNMLSPPQSVGTEKTILKDNQKEGFEPLPLNYDDSQMELNDYNNYGDENDKQEYYRRVLPGYSDQNVKHNLPSKSVDDFGNENLLNKINYMIQLLEDQHDEKTNNVTEEVVLYSFIGVFIIFIVDSFAKVGKYVR